MNPLRRVRSLLSVLLVLLPGLVATASAQCAGCPGLREAIANAPVIRRLDDRPLRSILENQPIRTVLENQPIRTVLENQPIRTVLESRPVLRVLENQPVRTALGNAEPLEKARWVVRISLQRVRAKLAAICDDGAHAPIAVPTPDAGPNGLPAYTEALDQAAQDLERIDALLGEAAGQPQEAPTPAPPLAPQFIVPQP